jgi:hypothetical protein
VAVELIETSSEDGIAPVSATVRVGPVVDYNGHLVPDDTPLEVWATHNGRRVDSEIVSSQAGRGEVTLLLAEPGQIQISARAGQAVADQAVSISVLAPPTPTPVPVTPTPTSTPTETPAPSPTAAGAPEPETASPTDTPPPAIADLPASPPATPASPVEFDTRHLDGVDLLAALAATLLAGLLGFWLGQQYRQPLSRRVRLGLWVLIGGLLAYLLYGAGWLRPEQWVFETPNLLAGRLAVAGLAFIFGLAALGLSYGPVRR